MPITKFDSPDRTLTNTVDGAAPFSWLFCLETGVAPLKSPGVAFVYGVRGLWLDESDVSVVSDSWLVRLPLLSRRVKYAVPPGVDPSPVEDDELDPVGYGTVPLDACPHPLLLLPEADIGGSVPC